MTLEAFILVFVSVFLHAGWNFLSKKTLPSLAFYAIATASAAVAWLPVLFWARIDLTSLPLSFWLLWLVSISFEFIYFLGLTNAYRRSDISLVYPLARAVPVLLTALITLVAGLGTRPGSLALGGMVVLSTGCFLMPQQSWRGFNWAAYRSIVLLFIATAAIGTTGYTIIDSITMRHLAETVSYVSSVRRAILFLFLMEAGLLLMLTVAILCSRHEQAAFKQLFGKTTTPVFSGLFSSGAYVLVLMAMERVTNVSYVQAFRQMSLPLGVLAGILFLHEKPGRPRLTGIALVVMGLILVALGR